MENLPRPALKLLFKQKEEGKIKLIITVDTEEDNWANYSTTDNSVNNIEQLIPLQILFDRYQVKPTYMITYPVATNPRSIEILREILAGGKCELGMHCHPWNTPPFEEVINDRNSMLCNLPASLVRKKLTVLHEAICENFNTIPQSFRAGRWAFDSSVAQAILELGYKIDTSVSPYINWKKYHGPDYSSFQLYPYRFDSHNIAIPNPIGDLLEVPATVGFLQDNFSRCQTWSEYLEAGIAKKYHIKGITNRLGLLNKVWLSPETTSSAKMISLTKRLKKMSYPCLNMSFHSSTLTSGLTPFVMNKKAETSLWKKIDNFLAYASSTNINSIRLSEINDLVPSRLDCYN